MKHKMESRVSGTRTRARAAPLSRRFFPPGSAGGVLTLSLPRAVPTNSPALSSRAEHIW